MFMRKSEFDSLKDEFRQRLRTTVSKDERRGVVLPDDAGDGGEQFSISKYLRGKLTGNWHRAEVEKKAHVEMEKDFSTDAEALGGALVPSAVWGQIIPRLADASVIRQLGCLVAPITSNQAIDFSGIDTGVTLTCGTEGGTISESTGPDFFKSVLAPKKIVARLIVSKELITSPGPAADAALKRELVTALAEYEDKLTLEGQGGTQPQGLYFHPRVNSTDLSGEVDQDDITRAALAVEQASATVNGWVSSPAVRHRIRRLKNADGSYLLALTGFGVAGGELMHAPALFGEKFLVTNQVSITGMPGSDESYLIGGDWGNLALGDGAMAITVSEHAEWDTDRLSIKLIKWFAALPLHPAAFVVVRGISVA